MRFACTDSPIAIIPCHCQKPQTVTRSKFPSQRQACNLPQPECTGSFRGWGILSKHRAFKKKKTKRIAIMPKRIRSHRPLVFLQCKRRCMCMILSSSCLSAADAQDTFSMLLLTMHSLLPNSLHNPVILPHITSSDCEDDCQLPHNPSIPQSAIAEDQLGSRGRLSVVLEQLRERRTEVR